MKQRFITGIPAAAGFIWLLLLGEIWFTGLILAAAIVGYYEFIRMFKFKLMQMTTLVGLIGVIYFVIPWKPFAISFETVAWLLLFMLLVITVITNNKFNIQRISLIMIAVVYIGLGFYYMIETRNMDNGLFWTFFIFACIWLTDMGAYFTGAVIGKHLLWPKISPKKTIEGAIGGIVFSICTAIIFSLFAPDLISLYYAIVLGFVISFIGQIGDLIQSAYKRAQGVKDSGRILPGHGGVLDRCDSWIIVFPFIHLLSMLPY